MTIEERILSAKRLARSRGPLAICEIGIGHTPVGAFPPARLPVELAAHLSIRVDQKLAQAQGVVFALQRTMCDSG